MSEVPIQFSAEVIEVKVKKAQSLDRVYRIVLETNQEQAILLQQFISESPVNVEVSL